MCCPGSWESELPRALLWKMAILSKILISYTRRPHLRGQVPWSPCWSSNLIWDLVGQILRWRLWSSNVTCLCEEDWPVTVSDIMGRWHSCLPMNLLLCTRVTRFHHWVSKLITRCTGSHMQMSGYWGNWKETYSVSNTESSQYTFRHIGHNEQSQISNEMHLRTNERHAQCNLMVQN